MSHPTSETLGAFIEGTLDTAGRAEVTAHLETCDECVMVVGETARMLDEPVATPFRSRSFRPHWTLYAAAVATVVFFSAWLIRNTIVDRDPVNRMAREASTLSSRLVEGRLSGFDYVPKKHIDRGSSDDVVVVTDPALYNVRAEAEPILEEAQQARNSAWKQHAAGVAALLLHDPVRAVTLLQRATELGPDNARYWNDLAVGELEKYNRTRDDESLNASLTAAERALRLDPSFADALFNRALALDRLGRTAEAAKAYDAYLQHDSTSQWADEARYLKSILLLDSPS